MPSGMTSTETPAQAGVFVVSAVCQRFRLSEADLYSQRRLPMLVRARWLVEYLMIERYGWSQPRVGKLLGLHHTSVLHGYRRAQELRRTDQTFYEHIEELEKLL